MLIDSTTSSLADDTMIVTSDVNVDEETVTTTTMTNVVALLGRSDDTDDDDDDDGYSIISHDIDHNGANVARTIQHNNVDNLTSKNIQGSPALIDNMCLVTTDSESTEQTKRLNDASDTNEDEIVIDVEIIEESEGKGDFTETSISKDDDSAAVENEFQMIVAPSKGNNDCNDEDVGDGKPNDGTYSNMPRMIRIAMIGLYFFILLCYVVNRFVIRTIHEEAEKLQQYKHQVQVQNVVTSSIIQQKDDTILSLQEQIEQRRVETEHAYNVYETEIRNWKEQVAILQEHIDDSNTNKKLRDQQDMIQTLQEQVRQLLEDASAMEVLYNQSEHRYKRDYRTVVEKYESCQTVAGMIQQGLNMANDEIDKCTERKEQLQTEIRHIRKERNEIKDKLRFSSKEIKDTTKEIKRQKTVIVKLQKQLADQIDATKKAKKLFRNNKMNWERDGNSYFHSESSNRNNDEYTTTFTWEDGRNNDSGGRSMRNDKKSIYVDNCWLYLQAKMDYGECIYDMKDHIHDQFHTINHKVHKSFRNVVKRIRKEMMMDQQF